MNKQFHKRPESSSRKARPITGKIPIQNQKLAEQCFEMGKRHMIKSQYNEALKQYNNALIHNPKDTKSLCNMGTIYKQLGQLQQSYECYMQALNINGDDYIATYNLANLERIRSNYENANALYLRVLKLKQKGIKLGTLDYDSLINRSICLEKLDDFDGAIESCNSAIKLNPKDESAYFNKAMNLMKKIYQSARGQFTNVTKSLCEQTRQQLQKILKMKPNLSRCKVALVQLQFLSNISKQNLEVTKKSFEELMKNDSNIGTHEVQIKLKLFDSIFNINNKLSNSKRLQPPVRPIINKQKKQPKPPKPVIINSLEKPISNQEPEIKKQNSIGRNQEITRKDQQEKQKKLGLNEQQKVEMIRKLVEQGKYSQAFIQTKGLDDKVQKYQLQIEINLAQIQQNTSTSNTHQFSLLQTALQIYCTKIKNDSDAVITTKTCTERGHEIMATLLNIASWYTQASKHYEILLEIANDKKQDKLSSEKKKDIHAGLGACYSETGRVREAIQEYENSLKIDPTNYFLMTNLCGLLIRDNREKQAKDIYKKFLDQNGGKEMANKTYYIDSLVNISICEKETPEEEKAIQLAVKEMQQYYPTYQDIKNNLDEEAILNLYLRWIDILEAKAGQELLSQEQTQKLNQKLLDCYLSCLQFENCPDRQAISINSGIIFYLNKFYTNALAFFRTITYLPNKKLLANNIGLTMAHLHEHEKAYSSFSLAVEENPGNIIYNTNFEIMKWIYGVSEINLLKYNCKCETMFDNRVKFGIYMFDRLTHMVIKNQVKLENESDSSQTIQSTVTNLINELMSPIKQTEQINFQIIKLQLLAKIFNQHTKECNQDNTHFINQNIVTRYLKVCGSDTQIEAGLENIFGFVSGLPKSSPKVTLCKGLIFVFLAVNSKKLGEQKVSVCWQNFKKRKSGLFLNSKTENLTVQHVDMKQAFQNIQHNLKVKSKITHPSLSFKMVENIVRDAECVFENSLQFVISKIQQQYYSKPNSLISPFELSYTHPHCANVVTCNECLIRYVQIYSSVFAKKIKYPLHLSSSENINQFFKQIEIFSKQCYEEGNPIFLKEEKEIEVKLQTKVLPFKLITHHKTIEGVIEFLKLLNNSFILHASDSKKGIQTLQLGKSLILQLWWGDVSSEDKIWHELQTKQNMITHSHVLANSYIDNLIEISEESTNGKEEHLGSVIANLFNGK